MIDELIKAALAGNAGSARDTARALSDPGLLPQFRAALGRRKISTVERKLLYEFLEYLARNSKSPAVAAFLLERLAIEKQEVTQLAILGTLWLLQDLDCTAIEPLLTSGSARVRHAALQALGACAGGRPIQLLTEALRQSEGGEETRQCASALARIGNEAAADAVIEKLKTIERSRPNTLAVTYLILAAYALGASRHLDWFRDAFASSPNGVDRWLLLSAICKLGDERDCGLVETEVDAYLSKPTGPANLLTGFTPIEHPTVFQAGMSFLRRICSARFERVARRAKDAELPDEDRAFLDGIAR